MLLRSYLLKTTAVGKPHRQGIIPFWHQRRNCGLLAAVHLPDKHAPNAPLSQHALLTDRHVLDQTTERLQHRGPDGRHVAMSSTSGNSAVNSSSGKVQWSLGKDISFRYSVVLLFSIGVCCSISDIVQEWRNVLSSVMFSLPHTY